MGLPTIAPYELPGEQDIGPVRAAWKPETNRLALLVHDMQNYFVAPFVRDAAPVAPAIANIDRLASRCRSLGIPVFYTAQNGDQDRRDRGLQADLWGSGMTSVPEHQDIITELRPQAGDRVLVKHRYSAFQRSNLETLMRASGRDQLIVSGIYAHIGCMVTAVEAFQRDIEPFFIIDALADFSRQNHDLAVNWVAGRCGVPMTTDRILSELA